MSGPLASILFIIRNRTATNVHVRKFCIYTQSKRIHDNLLVNFKELELEME